MELGPVGAILARTAVAPEACSDTFCQENGRASSSRFGARHHCMQRTVEQHRMHPETACRHVLRNRDLGEHLIPAPPHRRSDSWKAGPYP